MPMSKRFLLLGIDTESGGLDAKQHSLLTIGLVPAIFDTADLRVERLGERYHFQVKHQHYCCTPQALEVNGIDLDDHDQDPDSHSVSEIEQQLLGLSTALRIEHNFYQASTVFLAHNQAFDDRFITRNMPMFRDQMALTLCTKNLASKLKKVGKLHVGDTKLASLAVYFGLKQIEPHRADDDADLALGVFERLLPLTRMAHLPYTDFIKGRT